MSRGEFENVARALGGWEQLVNPAAKDKQTLACWMHWWLAEGGQAVRESAALQKRPLCATAKKATVGYQPRDLEKRGE